MEPMSIVQKGIQQTLAIQKRLAWDPRRAVVLGAGPVGMLAAAAPASARDRGRRVLPGARGILQGHAPAAAGISYISAASTPIESLPSGSGPIDVVFEATGATSVVFPAMRILGPNGVCILSSVTAARRRSTVDLATWNREMVLGNRLIFGTVNAGRLHFEMGPPGPRGHRGAAARMARGPDHAPHPVHRSPRAPSTARPDDIKTVLAVRLTRARMTKPQEPGERVIATNRKAFFNYEILDRAEAGVSLLGTEVKAIREGGFQLQGRASWSSEAASCSS
jgi:hypothetical protein